MTDQSTPTINNRIILSLKDYNGYDFCGEKSCKGQQKADELVSSMLEIIADFAERITPEKLDESGGWATLPSGQTVQDKDVANWNRGHNTCVDTITQNVKAELGAAPINSKEDE